MRCVGMGRLPGCGASANQGAGLGIDWTTLQWALLMGYIPRRFFVGLHGESPPLALPPCW